MQLLRNSLGLPYHRGRRRATPPPPAPALQLEDYVTAFQRTRGEGLLNTIRQAVEPLFVARGVPQEDADTLLRDCISEYDAFSGIRFMQLVISALDRKYTLLGADEEGLATSAYRGNGLFTFLETEESNPERIALARATKIERRQAAAAQENETETEMELQPVSETETEPELVNTSDQGIETEMETALEADQDGESEPEATPEPETEDINGLEYSDFMREIVQSWE